MAITNFTPTTDTSNPAYTASNTVAVTVMYLCNTNTTTPGGDATVNVYVVPNGETVGVQHKILSDLTVRGSDTYVMDTEKLILDNGDRIFVETPDSSGGLAVTISTIEV